MSTTPSPAPRRARLGALTGTDVLRVSDGQLAEYWVDSDTLLLLTQLQVGR